MQSKARHIYERQGPFTRARVTIYGRTEEEAVETARETVQLFADRLPSGVNCWAPSYQGYDEERGRHAAEFKIGFGSSDEEATRKQIDGLVEAL